MSPASGTSTIRDETIMKIQQRKTRLKHHRGYKGKKCRDMDEEREGEERWSDIDEEG